MAQKTKTISIRIPLELYEEIILETNKRKINISEWMFLQITLAKKAREQKALMEKFLEHLEKVLKDGKEVMESIG